MKNIITGGVFLHAPKTANISPFLRVFGNNSNFVFHNTENLVLQPFDFKSKVKTGAFFLAHESVPAIIHVPQKAATIYGTTVGNIHADLVKDQNMDYHYFFPNKLMRLKNEDNLKYRDAVKKYIQQSVDTEYYTTLIFSKFSTRSNISILANLISVNWFIVSHRGCSLLIWSNEELEVFKQVAQDYSIDMKIELVCTTAVDTSVTFLPVYLSNTWIRWFSAVRNLENYEEILKNNLRNVIYHKIIDNEESFDDYDCKLED
ncbi:MAG: hypothetical protein WC967_09380 [Balneolaceae bacterium]